MNDWTMFRSLLLLLGLLCAAPVHAQAPAVAFDQANKLYEQGKFAEAAASYEKIIQAGQKSATLYFNLGNAWFKAGQSGRAIAAYRQAEPLAPRDPNVRFNLQFVRKKVAGADAPLPGGWQQWLASLTLNEWTALAAVALWLWFLLLALREFRPPLRKTLRGYTATSGVVTLLLAGCLAAAAYQHSRVTPAIVIVAQAVVRYGPLDESNVFYQLRDGSEVIVVDEKELAVGDKKQSWLQVQDATGRTGWLKRDQVVLLK